MSTGDLQLLRTLRAGRDDGPVGHHGDDAGRVRGEVPGLGRGAVRGGDAGLDGLADAAGSRTKLAGVYLAGGSVHPGAGVPMATLSGRFAADAARSVAARTSLRPRGGARRVQLVVPRRAQRRRSARADDHRVRRQRVLAVLRAGAGPVALGDGRPARALRDQRGGVRARGDAWVLSEYGPARSERAPGRCVGAAAWRGRATALVVRFDERTAVFGQRVAGVVRLFPSALPAAPSGPRQPRAHTWWGVAPHAHVEAELTHPALAARGRVPRRELRRRAARGGVLDWSWSRASLVDRAAVLYDARRVDGSRAAARAGVPRDGRVEPLEAPRRVELGRSRWWLPRTTRTDGGEARVVRTLEDTPFYARSELETSLGGRGWRRCTSRCRSSASARRWSRRCCRFASVAGDGRDQGRTL
jgi:carotenoid 1,2-hydratase